MTQRQALEQYLSLLREIHSLALTENARLRAGSMPEEALLEKKRQFSRRLDVALQELAVGIPAPEAERALNRALQNRLQEQMLQTILLDRENESLLLKVSFKRCAALTQPPASALRKTYRA